MTWLAGWGYRKSHTINGSTAGAVSNYQIRIKVHRTTGTDSGEDVYVGTKCRADFGDIRFCESDGVTLLDYWLESYDGGVATFWVEVPSIPASPDTITIYIYYGKSDAATTSDGEDTFLFFDHFDVDLSKWTVRSGTWSIEAGELKSPSTDDAQIVASGFSALNCRIRARFRLNLVGLNYYGVMARTSDANNLYLQQYASPAFSPLHEIWKRVGGSWTKLTYVSITPDTNYHVSEFLLYGSSLKANIDGGSQLSTTDTTFATAQTFGFRHGETESYFYVDWVFVAKYVDPEPSHGAWGSEERRFYVTVAEKLGMIDGVTPKWSVHLTVAEKLGMIDDVTKVKTAHIVAAEKLGMIDDVLKKASYKVAAVEKLGLIDAVKRVRGVYVTVAEKLGLIDKEKARKIRIGDLPDHTIRGGA